MIKFFVATLATGIWISLSEFIRNQLLFLSFWQDHYKSLGLVFSTAPINGMVWGLWSFVFAGLICTIVTKFSYWQTVVVAWLSGFVLMWLTIGNLGVLPYKLLVFATPLSILETMVATYIATKIIKPNK